MSQHLREIRHFNPLPPCGGRLFRLEEIAPPLLFQSTPSVWRETTCIYARSQARRFQSTPSVWRETSQQHRCCGNAVFQSTPSVWRETAARPHRQRRSSDFNPLPPCGGRPPYFSLCVRINYFNPLPPCGGRLVEADPTVSVPDFNPLPPCGGRPSFRQIFRDGRYFNPLPPCGGRQRGVRESVLKGRFQSTPSVWRETRTMRC